MADESLSSNQYMLVRPPYNWWDAHSRYIPAHPSAVSITSPPSLPSTPTIDFLHPGYDFPANILFSLPTVDRCVVSSRSGVHHGTALTACMIITANRLGRLGTSISPPTEAALISPTFAWDTVLTEPRYYFHPAGENDSSLPPYPIVPDFRSWRFPHRQLPEQWVDPEYIRPAGANSTYMSVKVLERDVFCRVTGSTAGLHCSHVIPRSELDWFLNNTMSVYNANTILSQAHAIDDVTNGFALRSDLNRPGFDAGKLVVAPKEGKLVLHFLHDVDELGYLYHNRELHPIPTIPREFLFARFAWSIFPLLSRFLNTEKNLSVAKNVKSVWTVTEDFMRWVDEQPAKGSKRKRGAGGGDRPGRGSAVTLGVVDRMGYVFDDESAPDVGGDDCSGSFSGDGTAETNEEFSVSEPSCVLTDESEQHSKLAPLSRENDWDVDVRAPTVTAHEVGDPNEATTSLAHYFFSPTNELALDQRELAEDNRIAREIFPETLKGAMVNRDIAFYPGHRQIERLKQRLRRDRGWVTALAECRESDERGSSKRKRVDG